VSARRLLVTGGAGFVGSALVRRLLADEPGTEVVVLDALTYAGDRARLAEVADDPRLRFVHGDVGDEALVADALDGCEAVLHLAAESHVDRSLEDGRAFLRTNVLGTGVVLDAARRAGVGRVVHVSTDEVYGPVAPDRAAREDAAMAPTSPYSASKAGGDLLALAAARQGQDVVVLRPANTLGPWQHPEKLVPLFTTRLLAGHDVPVYGDGRARRDWLHVEDHVAAIRTVLAEGRSGRAYNVAGVGHRTVLEVAAALGEELGINPVPLRHVQDRPGHDPAYVVDDARLRALGWRPRWRFAEALADAAAWFRANEGWWGPLVEAGATERRGLSRGR